MKYFVFVLLIALASARLFQDNEYEYLFKSFMNQYNKAYGHDEFHVRYNNFKDNMDLIKSHNEKGKSFHLAMNEFGDMSWGEFRRTHLSLYPKRVGRLRNPNEALLVNTNLPDEVDWTKEGKVTDIKNQGQCGSCWAFSAVGSLEGAYSIKNDKLVSFSEQELVDCSSSYGNNGCNGGLMDYAFAYIKDKTGLCKEDDYAYVARDQSCKVSECTHVSGSGINGYTDVPENNEDALKAAVAITPVAVAIEADQSAFQFYSGGVFDDPCGTSLDHGVLAVGYGNKDGKDFWKVKNSWGPSWGDKGYIYMIRHSGSGSAGECGIASCPSYPTF